MTRSTRRARTRRTTSATTLGAIGAATAVGLTGTAAPAAAAPAPIDITREFAGLPQAAPRHTAGVTSIDRSPSETVYTVRAGDTVSHLAIRHDTTVRAIIEANELGSRAIIRIGQTLRIPGSGSGSASNGSSSSASSNSSSGSSSSSSSSSSYRVRAGDTVSGIAARHDTSVRAVIEANDLNSNALIRIGQTLRIPGSGSGSASNGSSSSASSNSSSGSSSSSSSSSSYRVRAGDTVSGIAARHDTSVRAVIEANDLNSNALIRIGQTLRIPGSASSGSSSTSSSNTASSDSSSSSSSSTSTTHRVVAGDTVSGIAARYGSSVSSITSENDLGSGALIRVGQTLRIPSGLVSNTFLHYTYSSDVTAAANVNKRTLLDTDLPSRTQMQSLIRQTASEMGVDPALAMAVAHQESGFNMTAVSPANAIGVMQVIPTSGEWASNLVGRNLNLLDPEDNVTAGVAILRQLQRSADNEREAIGGYYQGLGSVQRNGLYDDTRRYVANVQTLMTRYG